MNYSHVLWRDVAPVEESENVPSGQSHSNMHVKLTSFISDQRAKAGATKKKDNSAGLKESFIGPEFNDAFVRRVFLSFFLHNLLNLN